MIRNNRGGALVEVAIILPLLLLILVGILEFGRAMFIVNTLNHAAREGARQASISPAPINIYPFVESCIPFSTTDLDVTINNASPAPGSGIPITVTASLPYQSLTGFIQLPDGFSLSGQATMRYEM